MTNAGKGKAAEGSGTAGAVTKDICITLTPENPHSYPPFNLKHLPTYSNNQIHHYFTTRVMLDVDQEEFQKQMEVHKTMLKSIDWDGNTQEPTPTATELGAPPPARPLVPSFDDDGESDSDCPMPPPGHKGNKVTTSDITQLKYGSDIT